MGNTIETQRPAAERPWIPTNTLVWIARLLPFSLLTSLWLTQVLLLAGLAVWLVQGRFRHLKTSPVDAPLALLFVAVFVSWAQGAFLGWDGPRMGGLWILLMIPVFRGVSTANPNDGFKRLFALAAGFIGFYAWMQVVTGIDLAHFQSPKILRLEGQHFAAIGFFNRHHTFGTVCALLAAWVAGWNETGKNDSATEENTLENGLKWDNLVWPQAVGLIGLTLAVVASQSRAALFALLAGQAVVWFPRLSLKKRILAVFAAAGVLALAMLLGAGNRWSELVGSEGFSSRLAIWGVVEQGFSAALPLGVGYGRTFLGLDGLFSIFHPESLIRSGTHMDFLAFWLESGPLGALAFCWVLTALWLSPPGSFRWVKGLVVAFAITGLVHNSWFDGEVALCFWFLVAQGIQMPCQNKPIALEKWHG